MREEFRASEEYEQLAQTVIEENEDLKDLLDLNVGIAFVESNKEPKRNGRRTFGKCVKVPPLYQIFAPYDFIIVLYPENFKWFDEKQKKILLHHELMHIGVEELPDGSLGRKIVPHDVEDFKTIIDKHGLEWPIPEGKRKRNERQDSEFDYTYGDSSAACRSIAD